MSLHALCWLQVMAGTGNLKVLRLCRFLRSRVGPSYSYIIYGSHMAVGMAIGLLFLGGGRCVDVPKPQQHKHQQAVLEVCPLTCTNFKSVSYSCKI